ncbi:Aminodeoxychorismate lyase [Spathaspora sp. JA1]|nr:Aminodeoxychorismate lyase [Spathaspora sp. JA1]
MFDDKIVKQIHEDYIQANFPNEPPNFQILSTIRYDPNLTDPTPTTYSEITPDNLFLLPEHIERLKFTLQYFHLQFNTTIDYEINQDYLFQHIVQALENSQKSVTNPYKIRGLFDLDGRATIEIHDTPVRENLLDGLDSDPTYSLYIDSQATLISPFTSFKTTKRDVYTKARQSLPGLTNKEEVILYNTQNHVMEGSITNIAIKRNSDGKWITPLLSSGCLCGVTRHFLLRKGFIEEDVITIEMLSPGMEVLLFNGIVGVVKGVII